jgi:hypothetical protein
MWIYLSSLDREHLRRWMYRSRLRCRFGTELHDRVLFNQVDKANLGRIWVNINFSACQSVIGKLNCRDLISSAAIIEA